MYKKKLLKLLKIKEMYLKLREYTFKSKIQKAIDVIINQFDQQINKIADQIKMKLYNLES